MRQIRRLKPDQTKQIEDMNEGHRRRFYEVLQRRSSQSSQNDNQGKKFYRC
jgi:hypothetical protein